MLTFLFWNINGKPLSEAIAAIAERESVDILILAECKIARASLLRTLNRGGPAFHFAPSQNEQIAIFSRFGSKYLIPAFDSDRYSIRRLALPAQEEILLVVVHLPSKLYWREASQIQECTVLSSIIAEEEVRVGHSRTAVVGDFNMNPFEEGMIGAAGLHAVTTRKVAGRGTRVVQGRTYPFFYNPMWAHFGDALQRPPGSYYYDRAEHVTYFWNTFDQVLLRPQLMARFRNDQLRMIA